VAVTQQGSVVALDAPLALLALLPATFGVRHKLPLAVSIIYATAQQCDALVWTQDADFECLDGVRYFAKST
jgi:toxin FitB